MARVILVCGKVCAGKSTYARRLAAELPAVRLNPDEVMKGLFGEHLGDRHETVFADTMALLCEKAAETAKNGISVVVDAGFWQKKWREWAKAFLAEQGIVPEWHYVHVSDDTWRRNLEKRNAMALLPGSSDYYIDEGILQKFDPADEPARDEMDVWFENAWRAEKER